MSQDLFARAIADEDSQLPTPPAMLVFAHPDDEVVALGARIGRFRSALFVHVTDGAPRNEQDSQAHGFATLEEYRESREEELRRALLMAGLQNVSRERLEVPDQEASLHLAQLTDRILHILLEQKPEVVFTHPYEGGHPDHDACAFAVRRAVLRLSASRQPAPMIIEPAFYHAGPRGIETGCFLPGVNEAQEITCRLSRKEQMRKQALLACFSSQQATLRYFTTEHECFRIAPHYDFRKTPHPGSAFYDKFSWGMTSRRFCELACAAEQAEMTRVCH
jgi:LmbE family N-acetylglucosaminyl deacetylase